ncbi:hypothetical protein D3C86_1697620 [compost metagenome]
MQRIDRHDDTGRFTPPDGEVGFRQVGQDEGQHFTRGNAQVVEGIRRASDVFDEFGIAPVVGVPETGSVGEETQCRRVGAKPGCPGQCFISA